jgi:hypothetical protein
VSIYGVEVSVKQKIVRHVGMAFDEEEVLGLKMGIGIKLFPEAHPGDMTSF